MNSLPSDVGEEMKWCAWRASWHCSNTRKGYKSDAAKDKVAFDDHADSFKRNASGLLSTTTCDNIKWMFWEAGWCTANTRWNSREDAKNDKKRMEERYRSIRDSKEISEDLASTIKEMGWYAAWHCANTRVGYREDAKRDKETFESLARRIVKEKSSVIGEQQLVITMEAQQTVSFSVSVTEGEAREVGFDDGSLGFGKGKYHPSPEISSSTTLSQSICTGKSKTYDFSVTVPPRSAYGANATVHEADMDDPYKLTFHFGGELGSIYGTWEGGAVSMTTYKVNKQRSMHAILTEDCLGYSQRLERVFHTIVAHGQAQWYSFGVALKFTDSEITALSYNKTPADSLLAILRRKAVKTGEKDSEEVFLEACKRLDSPIYGIVKEELDKN